MSNQQLSKQQFIENGRDFVLAAMDTYVQQVLAFDQAKGWRDGDLSTLIPALDTHFSAVAERLAAPDSAEPGSMTLEFTE